MASNINRDYLVVIDVKSGTMNKPSMVFYNTDKNTSNIYAQLVIKETIVHATPIENATNYSVELKVVKPGNIVKMMTGTLVNEGEAIYEFDLPVDFINLDGTYAIEFWVKAKVADREEVITSSRGKYTVKASILTDLDEAIEDHEDYPLFLKLMEEVKVINETAHELDTTIRTLQSDMIEANNEMKTNEEQRQVNEATRVANETARVEAERARATNEATRVEAEATREGQEATRVANENERKTAENNRVADESVRATNEAERKSAEASRVSAENTRVADEEQRQTNEANRETAEEIRKANEQARISAENARVTEHEQMRTELNEVKAENAILMENDKKVADRMTQVEISDKRQYVIMEGLMNSAGDGYLKIEDTGNDTTLYNSVEGFVDVKNVTGNTMVNSIKNPDDEFTLNADINASGQSVTLTTAVDNGQVDVLAEGNTMVNVCDQQEAVAITKSYTVETGNHVALQGEYDGKARPVVYGNTLVNLIDITKITNASGIYFNGSVITMKESTSLWASCIFTDTVSLLKPSTKYTMIINIIENTTGTGIFVNNSDESVSCFENFAWGYVGDLGLTTKVLTTKSDLTGKQYSIRTNGEKIEGNYVKLQLMLLEGDYTNKPIPDYFTGMQSSFEDKVVTQEMVDSGKELAENLDKYRVDYKVTGKNKINIDNIMYNKTIGYGSIIDSSSVALTEFIPCQPNTAYTSNFGSNIHYWDKDKKYICYQANGLNSPNNARYMMKAIENYSTVNLNSLQLEEGSTATTYEPYKEFTKTYYLNSPLLEGDTIEESNGNVYHVHRYSKVVLDGSEKGWNISNQGGYPYAHVSILNYKSKLYSSMGYCNKLKYALVASATSNTMSIYASYGNKNIGIRITENDTVDSVITWLQSNPVTIIYELDSPTYELISQSDTILTDSYVAGHLDFDTAVPVERVVFNNLDFPVRYMYPSTNYTIQFEADNVGIVDIFSDNSFLLNQTIVKGLNKIAFTSSSTGYAGFNFSGIGCNISNIVVTEATDKDFGYFSGMKSVGELEGNKIEILSKNKNLLKIENESNYENCEKQSDGSIISNFPADRAYAWLRFKFNKQILPKGEYYITYKLKSLNGVYSTANGVRINNNTTVMNDSYVNIATPVSTDDYQNYCTKIVLNSDKEFNQIFIQMAEIVNTKVQIKDIMITKELDYNYVSHANNKKQILLNEPLRAVGDTKDRFVQIDGKWYVERNTAEMVLDGSKDEGWSGYKEKDNTIFMENQLRLLNRATIIADKIPTSTKDDIYILDDELIFINASGAIQLNLTKSKLFSLDASGFKSYLQSNPITIIYQLASPTYEPVEISPVLNTYTDVTHITNNSTIPMNMPIVNSGYEIIAKPSTKYTVVGITNGRIGDSTIVNGTITTPATLDDPFLRPYGTGKTSKVMLLEGELANIPGYFKGIKSVFEDKVTEDGKYAVEVKVVGKNKFNTYFENTVGDRCESKIPIYFDSHKSYVLTMPKLDELQGSYAVQLYLMEHRGYPYPVSDKAEGVVQLIADWLVNSKFKFTPKKSGYFYIQFRGQSSAVMSVTNIQLEEGTVATEYEPYHETKQTLYLDEPLYNTNNITIYNDKLGYWKNWDSVVLDGSEDENWDIDTAKESKTTIKPVLKGAINNAYINGDNTNLVCYKFIPKKIYDGDIEGIYYSSALNIHLRILKAKLSTQDVSAFRQYLSENPVTVVYELAEPVFVPLIDNCPNWIIGSWDNCSIHFDSIIPLKDTRYRYTGNVPSVMAMSNDVAEAKSISDQQDSMIIDLATDVAVMEMMLM